MNIKTAEPRLCIENAGKTICVEFYRFAKQFGHRIGFHGFNSQPIFANTVETFSEQVWPDAPPVQDVHFEDRGTSQVLLGLGMAGKSHYSVSIGSNLRDELKFEFACHVKEKPGFLGTVYSFAQASTGFHHSIKQGIIDQVISQDEHSLTEFESVAETDSLQNRAGLRVTPRTAYDGSASQTIQWGFSIRF